MKIFFTSLLLVFSLAMSAQEIGALQPSKSDEITGFKLYPNPATEDLVYITTQNNAPKTVLIYDVFGEVLLKDRMLTKALSIARLAPGVYVMQITEEKKTITRKLVVK